VLRAPGRCIHPRPCEQGAEQRIAPRRKALKGGKVGLSNWTTIDCTIRDVSDTGVRLSFSSPTGLPDAFRLLFVSGNRMSDVRTVWQKGLAAGLEFTGPEYDPPARKF